MPCPSGPEKGIKQIIMKISINLRVYGLLMRERRVLVAEEKVGHQEILKFPGGGVEVDETPEQALIREFREECQINITPIGLVHVPGTLFSPWIHRLYTPLFYEIKSLGKPTAHPSEKINLRFLNPSDLLNNDRVALPEREALKKILD
ncbi:MAG: hypothetical protein CL567_00805 [Alphaproteobacteria bacterium]|nr:hypothetical protein [Alphaproteobacteria bacterium]|tara:strand:- start:2028 stop:2471 length:444 start_codon:yes stop_codon:yes gene_type:complete